MAVKENKVTKCKNNANMQNYENGVSEQKNRHYSMIQTLYNMKKLCKLPNYIFFQQLNHFLPATQQTNLMYHQFLKLRKLLLLEIFSKLDLFQSKQTPHPG